MKKGEFIWKNGRIFSWDDERAKIHISNHSLNYGSDVFEGIRVYETPKNKNGTSAIFRLEDHVDRLFHSASVFKNDLRGFSKKEIRDAIIEIVRVNKIKEGYIRPIVFFGDGLGFNTGEIESEVAIFSVPWDRYFEGDGMRVCFSSYRKTHPQTTDPNAKICGNYQNSILAHLEAKTKGYDEGLLLDYKTNIAEGPGENIFFVKNKKLMTPSLESILPGITRDSILKLGKENGFEIEERILDPKKIYDMDEAFFCGTATEVTTIKEINYLGKSVIYKDNEITDKIKKKYMNTVRGKNEGHLDWLTFV